MMPMRMKGANSKSKTRLVTQNIMGMLIHTKSVMPKLRMKRFQS